MLKEVGSTLISEHSSPDKTLGISLNETKEGGESTLMDDESLRQYEHVHSNISSLREKIKKMENRLLKDSTMVKSWRLNRDTPSLESTAKSSNIHTMKNTNNASNAPRIHKYEKKDDVSNANGSGSYRSTRKKNEYDSALKRKKSQDKEQKQDYSSPFKKKMYSTNPDLSSNIQNQYFESKLKDIQREEKSLQRLLSQSAKKIKLQTSSNFLPQYDYDQDKRRYDDELSNASFGERNSLSASKAGTKDRFMESLERSPHIMDRYIAARNKTKDLQTELLRQRQKNHQYKAKIDSFTNKDTIIENILSQIKNLRSDYEILVKSFEHSERIRKEQKKIITELRKEMEMKDTTRKQVRTSKGQTQTQSQGQISLAFQHRARSRQAKQTKLTKDLTTGNTKKIKKKVNKISKTITSLPNTHTHTNR